MRSAIVGRPILALVAMLAGVAAPPLAAREVVDAAAPSDLSVTIYRDPDRAPDAPLARDNPQGFAMISETRRVTLPPGETTIRFVGVAEGMIGISAIVTGLPGGTIEKNRNTQLLSPAALVDGTLGNRVTITRTNPATGAVTSQQAIIRTRADGGLILQSDAGFEAVRCAGLPETLSFSRIPAGLSASPVFSVDTRSDTGGTYDVTLTYLAWGFDWQANYVARLAQQGGAGEFGLSLLSWLTLVNDNAQSFDDARLQIVAGKLNVTSDYEGLADPPRADPLRLTCYPIGSTAAGSPVGYPPPPPPPPPPPMYAPAPMMAAEAVVVTGARMRAESAVVTAAEENLGDLKLFRVPGRVDVAASGMKQVAFLNQPAVKARYLYQAGCDPAGRFDAIDAQPVPAGLLLVTKNEQRRGLGMALPQGTMTLYEPSPRGDVLAATANLRDYASGQEIELELGQSAQVFARCGAISADGAATAPRRWTKMRAVFSNANPHPVTMRLRVGYAGQSDIRFPGHKVVVKNGYQTAELTLPANSERSIDWQLRPAVP
ncbi:hypothetical protein C0V72_03775 [Porphyrobacter sp. TH134]|uniref:DUF4139 domain-containing protein n=1 Tax=Porphyrobacter sp. TH134 TaxID=2067450 RepID=UPI000C79B935|nr:hypothetical protein [Porphyrobacter sp. TH134]PLK24868.1 hypothetical protein C0V72_03775 [Porphyrobacter sp. TH134]